MKLDHLRLLCCPSCGSDLTLEDDRTIKGDRLEEGRLHCGGCALAWPVVASIPRFVSSDNYAANFGWQWNLHERTQVDRFVGRSISEDRFFEQTGWPRDLHGATILEAGCGSGRFTEQALSTGATVCSFDYSDAVEANYRNHGSNDRLLIVQADIYAMPFRKAAFDGVFCLGVLQHTPRVREAFEHVASRVRPGGSLAIDVSRWSLPRRLFDPRRYVQPFTSRMDHEQLYRWLDRHVARVWPLTARLHRLPQGRRLGRRMSRLLLVPDYRGLYDLPDDRLRTWALLDAFDMLSARYEKPQRLGAVARWLRSASFENVRVRPGYNGLEATGRRRKDEATGATGGQGRPRSDRQ